jgi:hypothetical protein
MHFYTTTDKGVEPRHFVPMASRPTELRPSRMSDLKAAAKRGESWVPSVTTILNVLDKPALVNWKVEQHLRQAINVDQRTDVEQWIAEVKRLTEIQMDIAPSAGTDIHKELEAWFTGNPVSQDVLHICKNVEAAVRSRAPLGSLISEKNFVSNGFGGQVDLHNNSWVIDFKSKQTADKFKPGKMAYDDHRMQLAAYREGLGLPHARAANVFVCLENGEVDFHEHTEAELGKGWELFQHALAIWQLQHGNAP